MNPIIEEVLKLPKEEKIKLYHALQGELEVETNEVAEGTLTDEQWREIDRRMEEIETGKMKTISRDEFKTFLKQRRNGL